MLMTPSPLSQLQNDLQSDMDAVNGVIQAKMQSGVPMIPELAGYIIKSGGKRLRPMLTVACAKGFGYNGDRHYNLATCVEFIHTATLLHDDVIDESEHRRGKPSANATFGNQASVLVGDFLFSRAFQLMVNDGDLQVLNALCKASATIAEGEVQQLSSLGDVTITSDDYFDIVRAKTSALFMAACEVGGRIAGCSPQQIDQLIAYGNALGIVFQITDDVLDYNGASDQLGKDIGDDFRERKVTLPMIYAIQAADTGEEKAFWRRVIGEGEQKDEDLEQAVAYMSYHDVFNKCLVEAKIHAVNAKKSIKDLGDNDLLALLGEIPNYCIERRS